MLLLQKLSSMASPSRPCSGSVMKPSFEHIICPSSKLHVLNQHVLLAFNISLPALPGKMVNTWLGLNKYFCIN